MSKEKFLSWGGEGEFTPRVNQSFFLGVKDVENSKPVFDPDFHTELIIKDEYEDCNSGNLAIYIKIEKNNLKLLVIKIFFKDIINLIQFQWKWSNEIGSTLTFLQIDWEIILFIYLIEIHLL